MTRADACTHARQCTARELKGMHACLPVSLSLPLLQDFAFNLLTARFDERTGLWAYTLGAMLRLYLRGWFLVDLVSASGCVCPVAVLSQPTVYAPVA